METKHFGPRLRQLRQQSGLSQRKLANKVNINFTYLSKIENGVVAAPSKSVVLRLAEVLNADKDELLILAGKIPSDVAQMLKKVETIKHLRKIGNRRKISLFNNKWGVSITKNLMSLTKYRSLAKVAIAVILTAVIISVLWVASPMSVKAVNFTFTPSQPSGVVGGSVNFSVKVDITNDDLLPINSIDLHIGDAFPSPTYGDHFQNLPIPSSSNTRIPTTGSISITGASSTIGVSATTGDWWAAVSMVNGSTRTGYGYGYRSPTPGWLGWGYWDFTGQFGYGYGYGSWVGPTSITYDIAWTAPSSWPAGTYQITLQVWGDTNNSIIGSTSFTITTAPAPAPEPGVTDVSNVVDEEGVFTEEVIAESEDGNISLTIGEGTTGLTEEGNPLREISILEMAEEDLPPPPEEGHVIGITYDIGPDGATFDEPITLTFNYDPDDLPEGVNEEDLVIAIWDEDAGEWVELPSVVDTENNTITATVSHFTPFAIIVPPPVEEEEVVTPPVEEEEVVTPPVEEEEVPPVVVEEEEEEVITPVAEEEEGLAWWIWLIVGLGSATVVGLLLYFFWWRRRIA